MAPPVGRPGGPGGRRGSTRRWVPVAIGALVLLATVSWSGPTAAGAGTGTSLGAPPTCAARCAATPPAILSSAPPILFSNWTEAYTLVASESVAWTCLACYGATLSSGPSSPNAGFHVRLPANATSVSFSVRACVVAACTYQNWTSTVLSAPVVTSTPSFFETPGVNYTYLPATANAGPGCAWSFAGAPYFTFEASTGALYAADPTNATYQNTETLHCASGSWTQSWYTVPSLGAGLPGSIQFSSGGSNVTMPTSDVLGSDGALTFVGEYPVLQSATPVYAMFDGGWNYSLASSGNVTYWYYGTPDTTLPVQVNGAARPEALPSSGFGSSTVAPHPGAPSNLTATPAVTSIAYNWTDPAAPLSSVSLQVGPSCGVWLVQLNVSPGVEHATATGLAPSTSYCARVAGTSSLGDVTVTGPAEFANATTLAAPLPAPTGLAATGETNASIALAWTNPSAHLTNVTLWYGTSCAALDTSVSVGVADSYNVTGLESGTVYCFAVQAWQNGTASPSSIPLTASTLSNPPPPGHPASSPWPSYLVPLVVAIVVILALLAVGLWWSRRRRPPASPENASPPASPTPPASPPPAATPGPGSPPPGHPRGPTRPN